MRNPTRLLAALLFACAACDQLPSGPPAEEQPAPTAVELGDGPSFATSINTVCYNTVWPFGMVVLSAYRNRGCPHPEWTFNAYRIGVPSPAGETICFPAPAALPSGFVIVRYGRKWNCPGDGPGAVSAERIFRPTSAALVCMDSPVPTGWVIDVYTRTAGCLGSPTGFNQMRIRPVRAGTVCATSTIPAGWVRRYYHRSTGCLGYSASGFNTVNIKLPVAGESVCLTTTLPPGWSYSRLGRSRACPDYSTTTMNTGVLKQG